MVVVVVVVVVMVAVAVVSVWGRREEEEKEREEKGGYVLSLFEPTRARKSEPTTTRDAPSVPLPPPPKK